MSDIKKFVEEVTSFKLNAAQMSIVEMLELRRLDHFSEPVLSEGAQMLVEDRLDFLKTNLGPKIKFDHDTTGKINEPNALIDHIANKVDPTVSKAHTQWVGTQYAKGNIRQEDFPRVKKALKGFEMVKKNLVNKDINGFKTLSDLEDHVAVQKPRAEAEIKAKEGKEQSQGLEKQYESEHGTGFKIPNKTTSISMYGSAGKAAQTNWCTAANSSNNMFNSYKGGKYTFHTPENNVLQFHHDSGQIMDVKDHHVNISSDHRFAPHAEGIKDFIRQTHGQEGFTTDAPSSLFKKTGVGFTKEQMAQNEESASKKLSGSYPSISRDHLESLSVNPHSPDHFEKVHDFIKQHSYKGAWYDDHIKAQHSLAQNPATPGHILQSIHDAHTGSDDAHGIRNNLAGNPNLPDEIRHHYKDYPEFASRRDLTSHEVDKIAGDSVNSLNLAKNTMVHLTPENQAKILQHGNSSTAHHLGVRGDLDPHIADKLFTDHEKQGQGMTHEIADKMQPETVHANISKLHRDANTTHIYNREDIQPETKEKMVTDGKIPTADIKPEHIDLAVKGGAYNDLALLHSKHLSKEQAGEIGGRVVSGGKNNHNLSTVFNHPKMPESIKTDAIRTHSAMQGYGSIDKFDGFKNIQPHHIDAVLGSGNIESIKHVPSMKSVQKSHFDQMVGDKRLHGAIVASKSAPPSILSKIASTTNSDYIKSKIKAHKNTPADVKSAITFDEDKV